MKFKDITTSIARSTNKIGFKLRKASPTICVVAGAVGVVAGTIMACKATTKLDETLDGAKKKIDKAKEYEQDTHEKKELTKAYISAGCDFVKLYGPAVAVEAASLGSIFAGHHILSKRNVALTAAYASLDNSFRQYKKNVADRFGTDVENDIRYGVTEETVTNEDGTTETVEKAHISGSDYSKFFDEASPYWVKDAEMNRTFLNSQQAYANDLLKTQGYLFLNDVYDLLGIDKTKAGQVIGWIYDEEHPVGDNYVDFGMYDGSNERKRAFVNGYEPSILLDFNVDGNIWELMK